jgi:hypothetical protein
MRMLAMWVGLLSACLGLPYVSDALAQSLPQTATHVEAGKETRVGFINPFDRATCKPRDSEVGRIWREPTNGVAEIRRESTVLLTRECGTLNVRGYAIYYRADSGFKGRDSIGFELRSDESDTTDVYAFPIDVR